MAYMGVSATAADNPFDTSALKDNAPASSNNKSNSGAPGGLFEQDTSRPATPPSTPNSLQPGAAQPPSTAPGQTAPIPSLPGPSSSGTNSLPTTTPGAPAESQPSTTPSPANRFGPNPFESPTAPSTPSGPANPTPDQSGQPTQPSEPGAQTQSPGTGGEEGKALTPPQVAIKAGFELLQQKKFDEAIEKFDTAIKLSPQEPLAYILKGAAERQLEHYDDAIEAYSDALDLPGLPDGTDRAQTLLNRGIAWFYKGEYGIAWEDFDEAAGLLNDEPMPVLWKGLARARQERWLEAVDAYAKAIELNPNLAVAHMNRGLAYLALNEPLKALVDFNQTVRHEPKNAAGYFNRGVALGRLGRNKEALNSYNDALRLKPDYAEAIFNRSLINRVLGDSTAAEKDRAAALKLNPKVQQPSGATS
jgi:Flp pilus assembly protein TadD